MNGSESFTDGNVRYLREKYATGFITLEELEIGLDSVLRGGPVNVPPGSAPPLPSPTIDHVMVGR